MLWRGKSRVVATLEALAQGKPASLTAFDSKAMREAVADVLAREAIDTIYVFSGPDGAILSRLIQARA